MSRLQNVDKDSWESFYDDGVHVLVIGKTTCNACKEWGTELQAFLEDETAYPGVDFGKINIDQGGLSKWKKANPWLADVTDLPCTIILKNGEIQKQFYGKGIARLTSRLDKIVEETGCCG